MMRWRMHRYLACCLVVSYRVMPQYVIDGDGRMIIRPAMEERSSDRLRGKLEARENQ